MANPTYLQLVNKVLIRLRETAVSSVSSTPYSTLMGEFLNMSKLDAENAYRWTDLRTVKTVSVLGDSSTILYSITGAGSKFRVISAWNTTAKFELVQRSEAEIDAMKFTVDGTTIPQQQVKYFCFRGLDGSGDAQIEIYPAANVAQTFSFNMYIPQAVLAADGDIISMPWEPVVESTFAMAIAERGEDGGLPTPFQDQRSKNILSDAISDDMHRAGEEEVDIYVQPLIGGGRR